ncbi:MAG: hypothetical protein QOJ13_2767 [Gaiellales bacterium]|jgi:hypothetical protein|nr:hypothetical protein [Gaiellales bacterium]
MRRVIELCLLIAAPVTVIAAFAFGSTSDGFGTLLVWFLVACVAAFWGGSVPADRDDPPG